MRLRRHRPPRRTRSSKRYVEQVKAAHRRAHRRGGARAAASSSPRRSAHEGPDPRHLRAPRAARRRAAPRRRPRGRRHRSPPVARRAQGHRDARRSTSASAPPRTCSASAAPRPSSTWRRSRTSTCRARIATASTSAARAPSSITAAHYGVKHVHLRRPPHLLRRRRRLAALPRRGRAADGDDHVPRARRSRRRRSLRRLGAVALSRARHQRPAHLLHARPDRCTGTLATFLRGAARADGARLRSALPVHARATTRPPPSALALEKQLRGVFNVAGPQPVPLSILIRAAGRTPRAAAGDRCSSWRSGASGCRRCRRAPSRTSSIPVVIDDSSFRTATGFNHAYDEDQTIAAFRSVAG